MEVLKAGAVVVVQRVVAVGASVDLECHELVDLLSGVLADGVDREDRAGANVDRHRGQIHGAVHGATAGLEIAGPPVVPFT